jgi:hypothetical protein
MINLTEKPIRTEESILMNIIQQAMELITKTYQENYEKMLVGEINLSNVITSTEEMVHELGTILVKDLLESTDEEIKKNRERKKEWVVERKEEEKTINTVLGEVRYRRTYYKNKVNGEYAHLLDRQVGIEPHERMDDSLRARLVENAAIMSYQKSIDQVSQSGITSRMSVCNAIKRVEIIPNDAVDIDKNRKEETPKVLYIEADEDHVAMQRGSSTIAKIVYVHEGKEKVSKNRYKLKNKRYFTDVKNNNQELWIDVADYLYKTYDMDKVEKIYLSGDGAGWIKEGSSWIDKSEYVLDKFHLSKYIRKATAHKDYMSRPIWTHINLGMQDEVKELLDIIIKDTESETKREAVKETKRYIVNNWEGIQRQKEKDYVGCSAEGHVSHIMSDRMSSRPMGWSREGLRIMSSMRVYRSNGGNFYEYIRRTKEKKKEQDRIIEFDKRLAKRARKAREAGIQNIRFINTAKKTGTGVLLKAARGI